MRICVNVWDTWMKSKSGKHLVDTLISYKYIPRTYTDSRRTWSTTCSVTTGRLECAWSGGRFNCWLFDGTPSGRQRASACSAKAVRAVAYRHSRRCRQKSTRCPGTERNHTIDNKSHDSEYTFEQYDEFQQSIQQQYNITDKRVNINNAQRND